MALPLVILYHFCPISPMIYHRENRNRSIKKKAKRFLKNRFAILFHYIQEYWKPPSFSLFNFVRVTSALGTVVSSNIKFVSKIMIFDIFIINLEYIHLLLLKSTEIKYHHIQFHKIHIIIAHEISQNIPEHFIWLG